MEMIELMQQSVVDSAPAINSRPVARQFLKGFLCGEQAGEKQDRPIGRSFRFDGQWW